MKNSVVTKYYFAGSTRLAVRTNGTLSYLLGDHIGSSSVTTDANGTKTASALYKAFGETRYTLGNLGTDYKFTGQRLQAELGIYWFQSRWMDPSLGRFTSPDTIVPTSTQGTQAWDRYGFVNNNPVRYNDPTGHVADGDAKQQEAVKCSDPKANNNGQEGQCSYDVPPTDCMVGLTPRDGCSETTLRPDQVSQLTTDMNTIATWEQNIGVGIGVIGAVLSAFKVTAPIGLPLVIVGAVLWGDGGMTATVASSISTNASTTGDTRMTVSNMVIPVGLDVTVRDLTGSKPSTPFSVPISSAAMMLRGITQYGYYPLFNH